jgi:hypothetical protein
MVIKATGMNQRYFFRVLRLLFVIQAEKPEPLKKYHREEEFARRLRAFENLDLCSTKYYLYIQ